MEPDKNLFLPVLPFYCLLEKTKCLLHFNNVNTTLLDELMIRRNCIVHDDERYDISLDELEAYYEAIEELLKNLALALKNINILVIDKGGFLEES